MIALFLASGCGSDGDGWGASSGLPPLEETGITFEDESGYTDYSSSYGSSYTESGSWIGQWGEIAFRNGGIVESYTGFVDWDGATSLCEVAYPMSGGEDVAGCAGCDPAKSFVLGPPEVTADEGGRCGELGWLALEGSTLEVGHTAPESLWQRVDGSWTQTGWSTLTERYWEFEIPL